MPHPSAGLRSPLAAATRRSPCCGRRKPSAAHPRSLSAEYGLGQQPLHTDGAYLADPPNIVALVSSRPSPTATQVWAAGAQAGKNQGSAGPSPAAFEHGMFLVHNGRDSFFAPAFC